MPDQCIQLLTKKFNNLQDASSYCYLFTENTLKHMGFVQQCYRKVKGLNQLILNNPTNNILECHPNLHSVTESQPTLSKEVV